MQCCQLYWTKFTKYCKTVEKQNLFSYLNIDLMYKIVHVSIWKRQLKCEYVKYFISWKHWIWNTIRILAFGVSHENLCNYWSMKVQIWSFNARVELLLYLKLCFLSWHNQKWNIACHGVICNIKVKNSAIKSSDWIVACETLSLRNIFIGLRIILDTDKVKPW